MFECRGLGKDWGTALFFNQRTNSDGRTTNEFCGSHELLADGRLAAKLGAADKRGDFVYIVQHTCRSDGDTALFKCMVGRRDQSDWAAESVELNEVELLGATTSNACKGRLLDTFIPTNTIEQCSADHPLANLLDDFVGQL
ncbi:hypothetical protein M3Y99_00151300 [Aphelenchoides fujianensis]|nr:hypothetical protein M3Y99_00151300 [Aphelenchoides fujianensis]